MGGRVIIVEADPLLELDNMADRHVGWNQAVAESYREAALVCLDRHHEPPQEFVLQTDNLNDGKIRVSWEAPDERCKGAWANLDDATRDGAYACAIAATEVARELYTVRRAETLTGADYYVAPTNEPPEDLENCLRLEVSGTARDTAEVRRRLKQKVRQAKEGQSNLPAIAVVIGFKVKIISFAAVPIS